MAVALAKTLRLDTFETLTEPIGTLPSTSRSRLPRYWDSEAHQARPAASAASRSLTLVLGAQAELNQLFFGPSQFWPKWSSLVPLPVRNSALRDMMSQNATWCARSIPWRRA